MSAPTTDWLHAVLVLVESARIMCEGGTGEFKKDLLRLHIALERFDRLNIIPPTLATPKGG